MKTRNGFVSNSSSTAFTFIFEGDTPDKLSDLIKKYNQFFELWNKDDDIEEEITCTADEVAQSVKDSLDTRVDKDPCYPTQFITLKEFNQRLEDRSDLLVRMLRKRHTDLVHDEMMELWDLQREAREAKERGLTHVVIAYFGDNDGPWAQTKLGQLMDYKGRNIYIDKKDFIVFTEQNR